MELAVVAAAEAFGVVAVADPVRRADVGDGGHVVDELVDIDLLPEFLVFRVVADLRRQAQPLVERGLVAGFLVVAVGILEGIHVVLVVAVVGSAVEFGGGLAQVEHADELAVEEDVRGLQVLAIDVDTAGEEGLLDDGVLDAPVLLRVVVVAAIAHEDHLVFVVGRAGEELVVELLLSVVEVACLELERGGRIVAAPSAYDAHLGLLVDGHLAVCGDVFEVDGPLPVHVDVAVAA